MTVFLEANVLSRSVSSLAGKIERWVIAKHSAQPQKGGETKQAKQSKAKRTNKETNKQTKTSLIRSFYTRDLTGKNRQMLSNTKERKGLFPGVTELKKARKEDGKKNNRKSRLALSYYGVTMVAILLHVQCIALP